MPASVRDMHDFWVRPAVRHDPRWHGRGVGGQLLTRAESWASDHDCGLLQVRSGVERTAAHGFYERAGYEHLKQQQVFTKVLA